MRYMMLVYTKENVAMSESEMATLAQTHSQVMDEARGKGIFHGAEPLARTDQAVTVRYKDGDLVVVDGPFAETKEQLAGYYILDCANLEEAISWASKIPTGCGGGRGSIEIRPFRFNGGDNMKSTKESKTE